MTTITQITDRPLLVVWQLDEPIHTESNNFTCGDPTCPCNEEVEQDRIVDEYPSIEQLDQMWRDRCRWLSDHL